MNSDWVDGERAAVLARIGGMGPGVSPEAESLRSRPRDSEDRAGERGWGPRVLPRGRESTLEAEGQRRPCRRAGVGPQSLTPRPRVYARGRGTAKSVPGERGWGPASSKKEDPMARDDGTGAGSVLLAFL